MLAWGSFLISRSLFSYKKPSRFNSGRHAGDARKARTPVKPEGISGRHKRDIKVGVQIEHPGRSLVRIDIRRKTRKGGACSTHSRQTYPRNNNSNPITISTRPAIRSRTLLTSSSSSLPNDTPRLRNPCSYRSRPALDDGLPSRAIWCGISKNRGPITRRSIPSANIAKPFGCRATSPCCSAHVSLPPNQFSSASQNTLQVIPRVRLSSTGNSISNRLPISYYDGSAPCWAEGDVRRRQHVALNSPTELVYCDLGQRIQQYRLLNSSRHELAQTTRVRGGIPCFPSRDSSRTGIEIQNCGPLSGRQRRLQR